MKLERISLQLRDGSVRAFDFHPGLTVIEAEPARTHLLIGALTGSLATVGDGIHVEASVDDGTHLVAFRPHGARHRVLDTDTSADLTTHFSSGAGVDVLAPWRAAAPAGRLERELVVTADDLLHGDPTEQWVQRLAQLDPDALLDAAAEEVAAEGELRRATAAARATPQEAAAIDELEAARADADVVRRRHNRFRVITLVAGSTLPVGAVIGLNTLGAAGAVGLIGASLALTTGCLAYERKLAHALEHEDQLAVAAGGEDARAVHEQVAASPLGDGDVRATLMEAAERYRRAAQVWQELAGNVPAPWVMAQGERIRRSAELRAAVAPPVPTEAAGPPDAPRSAALIAGLTDKVAGNRAATGGRESLPLLIDDPLDGLAWSEKAPVLELLGRLAGHHQLVLVTADDEVLAWARLEAMAGTIGAIVSAAPPSPRRRPRAPRPPPSLPGAPGRSGSVGGRDRGSAR